VKYSVIIPIYKNEANIERLVNTLTFINESLVEEIEAVFVVDGSPDNSFSLLKEYIEDVNFSAQILSHSRNFGSFAAIRSGLIAATGDYFGVMAADLQEPPELIVSFFKSLSSDECDVVVGARNSRQDNPFSRLTSSVFWAMYRKYIVKEMPAGGVDVFGCNRKFRDHLLKLEESRSSLIALIFWLGFRRKLIYYERLKRKEGKSSWTFKRKIEYMFDSIFSFTDYPIRLIMKIGAIGLSFSIIMGTLVLIAKLFGVLNVPGYAAIVFLILIFGTLNLLSLGLVGTYAWRAYENSKKRPLAIVAIIHQNRRSKNKCL
jgi:glycosyltransferase involved in cell wall biosynthesis